MNAKVNFQIPEQSISLYNTAHLRDIYSLAVNISAHTQTLLSRINKATLQLKQHAKNLNTNSYHFDEVENLISITSLLVEDRLNSFDVEREKYENELQSISLPYTPEDLFDTSSLIYEAIGWIQTMLYQIKEEASLAKSQIEQSIHCLVFSDLENLIYIAIHLIEAHGYTFHIECEKYKAEMEG